MLNRGVPNRGVWDSVSGTGLPPRVRCVGIGGGGVSALAALLSDQGHEVSGSDRRGAPDELLARGIPIDLAPDAARAAGVDLLVRSAAVPDDDVEVSAARRAGVPVLKYAEALGRLMSVRSGVAVAGTHGKTTTTSMLAHVLRAAGCDPSWVVGGTPCDFPASRWGAGPVMVAEACEYDLSFLSLDYRVAVITGVAPDHLDCFGDLAGVHAAFARFAARVPPGGTLVLGPGVAADLELPVVEGVAVRRVDRELVPTSCRADAGGLTAELLDARGGRHTVTVAVYGRHNLDNLRCALVAAEALGLPLPEACAAATGFAGVSRRLSDRGELPLFGRDVAGVRVFDDFAHHPDALTAAAAALAEHLPGRRRVAVFQPHQISRTEDLSDGFVSSLAGFDALALCDIFVARDVRPERAGAVLAALCARLDAETDLPVTRVGPASGADEAVRACLRPGDVCVVMGAGDVDGLARRLARAAPGP